jgi:hypothetical protein
MLRGGPDEESDVWSCGYGAEKEGLQSGVPVVEGLEVKPWLFGGVSEGVDWGDGQVEVLEGEGWRGGGIWDDVGLVVVDGGVGWVG